MGATMLLSDNKHNILHCYIPRELILEDTHNPESQGNGGDMDLDNSGENLFGNLNMSPLSKNQSDDSN